jgi:2-polyprenyl-3-methyl-5-hydroxy-6-metoxy-1,4-benzoquinol methylase
VSLTARQLESAEWGACLVSDDDLVLLSELAGVSMDEAATSVASYRLDSMAQAWRQRRPESPAEIRAFYRETQLYILEQLAWHGSRQYEPYLRRLDRMAALWPPSSHPRALDFGGGIGTAAIHLAERGYDVALAEVPGRTLDFATARFEQRGLRTAIESLATDQALLATEPWDLLVYYDVVEHLPDPEVTTSKLIRALRTGGGAAIVAGFTPGDERYPHHLPSTEARLGGYRWDAFLRRLGLREVDDALYVKRGAAGRAWGRARGLAWSGREALRQRR